MNTQIVPLIQDEDKETLLAKLAQAGEVIKTADLWHFRRKRSMVLAETL